MCPPALVVGESGVQLVKGSCVRRIGEPAEGAWIKILPMQHANAVPRSQRLL